MKFVYLLLLTLSLFFSQAHAQSSLIERYEMSFNRISGYRGEISFERLNETLEIAKEIADLSGISYREITLSTRQGQNYKALKLLPNNSSSVGREVFELENNFGAIDLVLSPYDLIRSKANAFFNPDGSMIGAPKEIVQDILSSSYFHEKMHAATYQKLINGEDETYAGSMRLLEGERISEANNSGYIRHASFDEFLATEYSAVQGIKELYQISRQQEHRSFINSRENEEILAGIKFDLENLIGLAKQNMDVVAQVRNQIREQNYQIERSETVLGHSLRIDSYDIVVFINSIERVFANGSGFNQAVPKGTKVILKATEIDEEKLIERLNRIENMSKNIANKYPAVLNLIGTRIFYADLPTTDVARLYQAIQ